MLLDYGWDPNHSQKPAVIKDPAIHIALNHCSMLCLYGADFNTCNDRNMSVWDYVNSSLREDKFKQFISSMLVEVEQLTYLKSQADILLCYQDKSVYGNSHVSNTQLELFQQIITQCQQVADTYMVFAMKHEEKSIIIKEQVAGKELEQFYRREALEYSYHACYYLNKICLNTLSSTKINAIQNYRTYLDKIFATIIIGFIEPLHNHKVQHI